MNAPRTRTNLPAARGPSAGEWSIVILLGCAGLVAVYLGRQHLMGLRTEISNLAVGQIRSQVSLPPASAPAVVQPPPPPAGEVGLLTAEHLRRQSVQRLSGYFRGGTVALARSVAAVASRGRPTNSPLPAYMPGNDGRYLPAFAEILGLSAAEFAAVNSTSTRIKQQLDALVVANTQVVPAGGDAYRFEIGAVPEADALRDQYVGAMQELLGPERYQLFALLNGEIDPGAEAAAMERRIRTATKAGDVLPPGQLAPSGRVSGPATLFGSFGAAA
jgi:hypothetical protein